MIRILGVKQALPNLALRHFRKQIFLFPFFGGYLWQVIVGIELIVTGNTNYTMRMSGIVT